MKVGEISRETVEQAVAAVERESRWLSIKLHAHYAKLLNQYDGGRRHVFRNADEWITRWLEPKPAELERQS